jgi:hypothetical protein
MNLLLYIIFVCYLLDFDYACAWLYYLWCVRLMLFVCFIFVIYETILFIICDLCYLSVLCLLFVRLCYCLWDLFVLLFVNSYVVVAKGRVLPRGDGMIHGAPLPPDHHRVSIDCVMDGCRDYQLSCSTNDATCPQL